MLDVSHAIHAAMIPILISISKTSFPQLMHTPVPTLRHSQRQTPGGQRECCGRCAHLSGAPPRFDAAARHHMSAMRQGEMGTLVRDGEGEGIAPEWQSVVFLCDIKMPHSPLVGCTPKLAPGRGLHSGGLQK